MELTISRLENQDVHFQSNVRVYVATEIQEAKIGIINGAANEPKNSHNFPQLPAIDRGKV